VAQTGQRWKAGHWERSGLPWGSWDSLHPVATECTGPPLQVYIILYVNLTGIWDAQIAGKTLFLGVSMRECLEQINISLIIQCVEGTDRIKR
jgi:hypothetical protein